MGKPLYGQWGHKRNPNPCTHSLTSLHTTQMEPRLDTQGIKMTVPATWKCGIIAPNSIWIKPSQNLTHLNQKTLLMQHTVIGRRTVIWYIKPVEVKFMLLKLIYVKIQRV